MISQLRQYEDESRHFSSRGTYENKNSGRANNAAHISPFPQAETFSRGRHHYAYSEEQVTTDYLRRVRDHVQVFREIKPEVGSYATELEHFEHQCNTYRIRTGELKYKILTIIWAPQDIKDFWDATPEEGRNYINLREYLRLKDGPLTRILRARPQSSTFNKYSDLLIEATKWAKSKLEDIIKFFTYYLAPDALKEDVRSNFVFSPEEFNHRNRASFYMHEQRVLDSAREVNYQPIINNYHQARQRNRNRSRNNYGGNQRANFNNFANNRGQYNDQNANNNAYMRNLCETHLKFADGAWECKQPYTCPMANVIAPRPQQKNDLPPSAQ